ncbi:hypothetical protein ASPSYDRAFT_45029, partial [Aspergillus sydowii CBS 593.65]
MGILFLLLYLLHPSRTRAAQLQENSVYVTSRAALLVSISFVSGLRCMERLEDLPHLTGVSRYSSRGTAMFTLPCRLSGSSVLQLHTC